MNSEISNVIITGGRETGGLQSYAMALAAGFTELGIPAEVISPARVLSRWRDLRDKSTLKILSTTAVFATPFCRRAICMAHGFPRVDAQGWVTVTALVASFKLASICANTRIVTISHYAASHLKAIYNIEADGIVHNPLDPIFFEPVEDVSERTYLTYVGRLHPVKNIGRLLSAMRAIIDECSDGNQKMRICIVGDGPLRHDLHDRFGNDSRIEFTGNLDVLSVRKILRKTRTFVSGCETEALGIAYLEALSQGCSVVMPACGGGLEIAPDLIGSQIQLLPLSFDQGEIQSAIRYALDSCNKTVTLDAYRAKAVADQYLKIAAMVP